MTMRGGSREMRRVAPHDFRWDRALIATLRHSTLPWNEDVAAKPLASAQLGTRDRLSVLAQFAAHQAMLQFAGIADGEVEASEWIVVQKRGADTRLVRIGARAPDADGPPPLTLAQQFAELVHAPDLDIFRQSWARAEAVYIDCFAKLTGDLAVDLSWTRAAAAGVILSPGPDLLRELPQGRSTYSDESCIEAIRAFGLDVRVLRGGSIMRYGALAELNVDPRLAETEVVERIGNDAVVVAIDPETFDPASKRVLQLLGSVLIPGADPVLPPSRRFVVAPSLALAQAAVHIDVQSGELDELLLRGVVSPRREVEIAEPVRSYIAVLSLLGNEIPSAVATRLLREFTDVALDDLVVKGITSFDGTTFRVAKNASHLIPSSSRAAICRIAANVAEESGDLVRAATLLTDAGDLARAAMLLDQVAWSDDAAVVLWSMPRRVLSSKLAKILTRALIQAARYRDAREIAALIDDDDRELALAFIERRSGDYGPALARLERLSGERADALRAEVLSILRRPADAAEAISRTKNPYLRALILGEDVALESPYFRERLATYRALERDDADAALAHIANALSAAECAIHRIDAMMDRVYTLFQAGRWSEARAAALEALAVVEETQGDRAAGGLLFLLAYLYADEGLLVQAAQRIERLRHFYGATKDEEHLAELDLLAAHLDFCRGRFDAAHRAATALLSRAHDAPILEAAGVIVDEIDFLRGRAIESRVEPHNVELRKRHDNVRSGVRTKRLERLLDLEETSPRDSSGPELRFLRALALDDLAAIDIGWRYVTRNRLGHWSEPGPLDEIAAALPPDWIAPSDRELLFIEGCSAWPQESRDAVAGAFSVRDELQRLRRLAAHEDTDERPRAAAAGMLGDSLAIRDVLSRIALVARRDVAVCILGESGTGKELAARAIHANSPRRSKTFTAVNCAALPENLIESELFGHMRGAFTGADRDRAGLIETTDGGTLFLDEIGEMPLTAQAKLLRFLQDGEFRRVGEATNRSSDVRIVTATNRKLEAAVEEGRFREDLYYRVRGVEVSLPPLRERGDDILLLARSFLAREREKHRGGPSLLSNEVESLFLSYGWPGNVRELQNTVRAAHAIADDAKEIALEHLPDRLRNTAVTRVAIGSYQDAVMRFKRDLIENALSQSNGNQNRAASLLKISRQALGYQIRELGILTAKSLSRSEERRVAKPSRLASRHLRRA
ncbi:MAG TPA: sigma 54-interacting transcriptional regulator [Thermoanaerobaculia bacterium]|nr:sigma 54-interacting transcriptional regulator [Thermoanaerobaculia bacterium]